MKKLMIAAAAAAMIGGAEANMAVYDFNAYLTTTTGEKFDAFQATVPYHFGANLAQTLMWYDDNTADNLAAVPVVRGLAGKVDRSTTPYSWAAKVAPATGTFQDDFPHLIWTTGYDAFGNAYSTLSQTSFDLNQAERELVQTLARTYTFWFGDNWCGEIFDRVPGGCFRTPAGDSITQLLGIDDANCCTAGNAAEKTFFRVVRNNAGNIVNPAGVRAPVATWGVMHGTLFGAGYNAGNEDGILNYFGGRTLAESTLVEMLARIDNVFTDVGGLPFVGYIAGQGNRGDVAVVAGAPFNAVSTIAGNIVGSTTAAQCVNCCVLPLAQGAIAFDFCANYAAIYAAGAEAANGALRTAAYGTFYLQFNSYVRGL